MGQLDQLVSIIFIFIGGKMIREEFLAQPEVDYISNPIYDSNLDRFFDSIHAAKEEYEFFEEDFSKSQLHPTTEYYIFKSTMWTPDKIEELNKCLEYMGDKGKND